MLGLCCLPTTQDPAELTLKPGLLLQAWTHGLYLKHVRIHRAGLCQDLIASERVKSHFAPSFSVVPECFKGGFLVSVVKAGEWG